MFNCFKKKPVRELPEPDEQPIGKLGVIVGHTSRAKGARFALGGYEYDYNSHIARLISARAAESKTVECEVFTRNSGGISGAYQSAIQAGCDVIIELHFNAFNTKVAGTETLCTTDPKDRVFAEYVHRDICQAFGRDGDSRGVKPLSRSSRGGRNVYSAGIIPNCLVEPFFGDNPDEAKLASMIKDSYAKAIVHAVSLYFREQMGLK